MAYGDHLPVSSLFKNGEKIIYTVKKILNMDTNKRKTK